VTIVEATPASLPLKRHVERIWEQLESVTVGAMSEPRRDAALEMLRELEENLTTRAQE
jgi:hypothetical protein